MIRALWTEEKVDLSRPLLQSQRRDDGAEAGAASRCRSGWGSAIPNAVRRAAALADGWMGSGGSSIAAFCRVGADPAGGAGGGRAAIPASFPISKRVFMAVDERPEVARARAASAGSPRCTATRRHRACGIHGTPEQVRERLEEMVAMGANHLLAQPGLALCRTGRGAGRSRGAVIGVKSHELGQDRLR